MSRPFIPIEERFQDKYIPEPNSGCWLWIGSVGDDGYGNIGEGGRGSPNLKAHRVSYGIHKGPIPEGKKNRPRGVIWIECRKKWRVYTSKGKFTHLGYFDTEEEAYEALVRAKGG